MAWSKSSHNHGWPTSACGPDGTVAYVNMALALSTMFLEGCKSMWHYGPQSLKCFYNLAFNCRFAGLALDLIQKSCSLPHTRGKQAI